MKIIDEIFRYKDPKFQTFLMLKKFILRQEKYKPSRNASSEMSSKNQK